MGIGPLEQVTITLVLLELFNLAAVKWCPLVVTVILGNQSQKSRIGKDHYGNMQEVDNNYVYITIPVYTMS